MLHLELVSASRGLSNLQFGVSHNPCNPVVDPERSFDSFLVTLFPTCFVWERGVSLSSARGSTGDSGRDWKESSDEVFVSYRSQCHPSIHLQYQTLALCLRRSYQQIYLSVSVRLNMNIISSVPFLCFGQVLQEHHGLLVTEVWTSTASSSARLLNFP